MTTELVELADRLDKKVCDLWLAGSNYREGTAGWNKYNDLIKLLTEAAIAIRALASRAGGWVSVKDRLPDKAGLAYPVLAFNAERPRKGVWMETMHPSWWGQFIENCNEWGPTITHWQPLPEPPAAPEPVGLGSDNSTNDEEM